MASRVVAGGLFNVKRAFTNRCSSAMVRNGRAFYFDNSGKVKDRFPKESRNSNGVCHVRPHARVEADHFDLPVPDRETGITSYTKQSFWFNKDFVKGMCK